MAKILSKEELENYIDSLSKVNKDELIKRQANAAKEVNKLRQQLLNITEESERLEKLNKELTDRETALAPKEERLEKLQAAYIENKADLDARAIEIDAKEKAFEKTKASLENIMNQIADEKIRIVTEFENKAKETYALREEAIERDLNKRREAAQADYDSTIAQANKTAEQIRKQAEANSASLKEQLDDALNAKALSDAKKTELEGQIKTLEETNKILSDKVKDFERFEILNRTIEDSGLTVKGIIEAIQSLEESKQQLAEEKVSLQEQRTSLGMTLKRLENRENDLNEREDNLDEEARKKVAEENYAREVELQTTKRSLNELRTMYSAQQDAATLMENLEKRLGENPQKALLKIENYNEQMRQLEEEVANLPSYMTKKKAAELHERENELEEMRNELERKLKDAEQVHKDVITLQAENEEIKKQKENKEKDLQIIKEELDRLRSTYNNPQQEEERIAQINIPCEGFEEVPDRLSDYSKDEWPESEKEWLDGIKTKIEQSGFVFPDRIINAFHTALKTAEMSPLTVLAGVSGTGKSKLPEYYSRYGGINFLSVPVQPNWDCQESMTGFYNSIDNCYEPTEVLKLLAQSQRDPDNQNGLNDVMTMILLDEMNLANVELYFADFLSKLETRRGHDDSDLPSILIKLGAGKGIKKWPLKLGRNVLWTGTMNQDETTKTLSDKVLDRGIVINFPRPDKFESLPKTTILPASPLLPKSLWNEWVNNKYDFAQNDYANKILNDKKLIIESINRELGRAGRALGHRVWQSIELYMASYPDVIAADNDTSRKVAMENAFEDQLVQKVMPKLRGIETRGTQGDVLTKIKGLIPESLHDDYKNATDQGYGQFMWTSSGYLLRDEKKDDALKDTIEINDIVLSEKEQSNEDGIISKIINLIKTDKLGYNSREVINYLKSNGYEDYKEIKESVFSKLHEEGFSKR